MCTCTVLMFTYKTVISGQKLFHCKISITVLEINLHNADDRSENQMAKSRFEKMELKS